MAPITVVMILVLVAIGWVALSPDKLADTLRTRFKGAKARVADALDDAVARIDSAQEEAEAKLSKAREALITIMARRRLIQGQVETKKQSISMLDAAAEGAAREQRREVVQAALDRKQIAVGVLAALQKQLEFVQGKEAEVLQAVRQFEAYTENLKRTRVELVTRAQTATTVLEINELKAGLDLTGTTRSQDMQRATELVEQLEAKAGAVSEFAEGTTTEQNMTAELERLAAPPQTDVNAEVEALMAKFKPV